MSVPASTPLRKRRPVSAWAQPVLRYLVLIAVGLVMLYPLLWMIGGAFKPNSGAITQHVFPDPLKTG